METKNRNIKSNKKESDLIFNTSSEIIEFRTNSHMLEYEVNNDYQENKHIYKLREKLNNKTQKRLFIENKYGATTDEANKRRWITALIAVIAYVFLSYIFVYVLQFGLIAIYGITHNGDMGLSPDSPLYESATEFYNSLLNIILYTIEIIIIIPILFGYIRYDFMRFFKTEKSTLIGLLTTIFSFYIIFIPYAIGLVITLILGGNDTSANQSAINSILFGKYGALLIICVAIIGPIVEELVFRKGLHSLLFPKKKAFGWKMLRCAIVACIFGSIHVLSPMLASLISFDFVGVWKEFVYVFPYIGMGFGFCFLYEINDQNIIPSTIAHIGWNSYSVISSMLLPLLEELLNSAL